MAQLIQFKRRAASGIPDILLAGEPLYNMAENAFYIGTGSAVVRFDAGAFNGDCSTAAATAAKVVACPGIVLLKGVEVTIKFTVTNTVAPASLTLNVGGTGAKAIKYRGVDLPSANVLSKNRTYKFRYNGTQWELIGDLDTDTTVGAALSSHTGNSTIHITGAERTKWDKVVTDFGNLEIGGRNLALNSSEPLYRSTSNRKRVKISLPPFLTYPSDFATVSFQVRNAEQQFQGYFYDHIVRYEDSSSSFSPNSINSDKWETVKTIIDLSRIKNVEDLQDLSFTIRYYPDFNDPINADIRNVMVSFGNKATDWSPAPEDQVSDWLTTDVNSFSFIKNKPTLLSQFTDNIGVATHIANTSNPHAVTTSQIGAVDLTTNQTIGGVKTFTGNITAPTAKLTNLTNGYIPYHVSDASGLANSVIFTDGTNVGIGYTAPGSYRLKVNGSGYFNSNLTVGGTLGVTGASTLSSARITSAIYFGSSGTDYQINSSGSAKLYDTWVYNLSVKHEKPFINFYFGNGSNVTSRIIEQATGVLDVIGSVKIPDSKYFQIGNAKFTYETVGGVGFLKLAHSNGSTAMHLVTTGGQTMYSTGVPATGGGGGAIIQLNGATVGEGDTATIYSPTSIGYPGYILKAANPSGLPVWDSITNLLPDASTSVKGVAMLAGSGSATTVARSDHNHTGVYAAASHGHAMLSGLQINYTDSNSDPQNMLIRTGANDDDILLGNGDHETIIYGSSVKLQDFGAGFIKSSATGVLSVDTNTYLTGITKTMVDAVSCNADTVDGLHATSFLRSNAANSSDIAWSSVSGMGIRFWNNEKYKIFMAATADTTYGNRIYGDTSSDYNMYFRIGDGTNRGFVFESSYSVKLASINPSGIISNVGMTFNSGTIKGAVIGNYGVCSTVAATVAKTVSIAGLRLVAGVVIYVQFTNGNTVGSTMTLNVNGTGAKSVILNGNTYPSSLENIQTGDILTLIYDGSNFRVPIGSNLNG